MAMSFVQGLDVLRTRRAQPFFKGLEARITPITG